MQADYDWLWLWRGAQQRAVQFRSVLKARIDTLGDKCWDELCADSKAAQHFKALAFLLGTRRSLFSLAGKEPPALTVPKQQGKKKAVKTEETQHTQAILDYSRRLHVRAAQEGRGNGPGHVQHLRDDLPHDGAGAVRRRVRGGPVRARPLRPRAVRAASSPSLALHAARVPQRRCAESVGPSPCRTSSRSRRSRVSRRSSSKASCSEPPKISDATPPRTRKAGAQLRSKRRTVARC